MEGVGIQQKRGKGNFIERLQRRVKENEGK